MYHPESSISCFTLKDDDDDENLNEGVEDPTGRERVQNALGEDTSSAAVTRSKIFANIVQRASASYRERPFREVLSHLLLSQVPDKAFAETAEPAEG